MRLGPEPGPSWDRDSSWQRASAARPPSHLSVQSPSRDQPEKASQAWQEHAGLYSRGKVSPSAAVSLILLLRPPRLEGA